MQIFSERRGQWRAATQSQEFFRTLQRYYSNAWMDAEKQDAINVYVLQLWIFLFFCMSPGYIISSGWIPSMPVVFLLFLFCLYPSIIGSLCFGQPYSFYKWKEG